MPKIPTIGEEILKVLHAYKDDIISEEIALQRIGEKFNALGQNQSLVLQQESIKIGKVGTQLQAEQNVILKQLLKHLTKGKVKL